MSRYRPSLSHQVRPKVRSSTLDPQPVLSLFPPQPKKHPTSVLSLGCSIKVRRLTFLSFLSALHSFRLVCRFLCPCAPFRYPAPDRFRLPKRPVPYPVLRAPPQTSKSRSHPPWILPRICHPQACSIHVSVFHSDRSAVASVLRSFHPDRSFLPSRLWSPCLLRPPGRNAFAALLVSQCLPNLLLYILSSVVRSSVITLSDCRHPHFFSTSFTSSRLSRSCLVPRARRVVYASCAPHCCTRGEIVHRNTVNAL